MQTPSSIDWKPESAISIQLFGGPRINLPGGPSIGDLGSQTVALLCKLALAPSQSHSRDELIDFLWPDELPDNGRRMLRQLVYRLRSRLEACVGSPVDLFESGRNTLRLNDRSIVVDAVEFSRLITEAAQSRDLAAQASLLESAIDCYQGELLPGYYHDFIVQQRDWFAHTHYQALYQLSDIYDRTGRQESAIVAARRAVEVNPVSEEAYRILMRQYALQGKPSEVLKLYRTLEATLRQELDTEPSPSTRQLLGSLRELDSVQPAPRISRPSSDPAPASLEARTDLPRRSLSRKGAAIIGILSVVLSVGAAYMIRSDRPAGVDTKSPPSHPSPATSPPVWVARYRAGPGDRDSEPISVVTDRAGNCYVAGLIQTQSNDVDYLVLKLDVNGRQVWEFRYNGPGDDVDRARSIALDDSGNVYVTGDSCRGKGNGTTRLSSLDIATIKLGPDGRPSGTWPDTGFGRGVRRYNGPANGEDAPRKVLVTEEGDVLILGSSQGLRTDSDIVLVNYTASGREQWVSRYDGHAHNLDTASEVACVGDSVYVVGSSRSAPPGGPEMDVVTLKFARKNGGLIWARTWGEANGHDDQGKFIALDHMGDPRVICVGRTGPGTFNHERTGCVVLYYRSDGNLQWSRGSSSESNQIDTVWSGGGNETAWVLGPYSGYTRIIERSGSGHPTRQVDYPASRGGAVAFSITGSLAHYVTGWQLGDGFDGVQTDLDYLTVAVDPGARIVRQWLYRGMEGSKGVDRGMCLAAWHRPGSNFEHIVISGQSQGRRHSEITTVCYRFP